MRQFKRSDRLSGQILRDISSLMHEELSQVFKGMISFTRVDLSGDLRHAKVFYSFLGEEAERDQLTEFFDREGKRIRKAVGRNLRIRHIPEMSFHFDSSIEHSVRVEKLLNELQSDPREGD